MGLFVRTIGIARARMKIGMANLAYNINTLRLTREKGGVRLRQHRAQTIDARRSPASSSYHGPAIPLTITLQAVLPR